MAKVEGGKINHALGQVMGQRVNRTDGSELSKREEARFEDMKEDIVETRLFCPAVIARRKAEGAFEEHGEGGELGAPRRVGRLMGDNPHRRVQSMERRGRLTLESR